MQTVDATHAEHDGGQPECAGIVENILIGRTFGTTVGTMKVKRPIFTYTGSQAGVERLIPGAVLFKRQIGQRAVALVPWAETIS
jgi:hypothetical protein